MSGSRALMHWLLILTAIVSWPLWAADLELRADAARILGPFVRTNGCIFQTVQTGLTNGGQAVFEFSVDSAGAYSIAAVVDAPAGSRHSFFVSMDGGPRDSTAVWEVPSTVGFATNIVCTAEGGRNRLRVFHLSAGPHQLAIVGREPGTKLAKVTIAKLQPPAPPTGLRVVGGQ